MILIIEVTCLNKIVFLKSAQTDVIFNVLVQAVLFEVSNYILEIVMNILISACLLGIHCKYDGSVFEVSEHVKLLMKKHNLIPFCPEIYGGLATPRDPAEIAGSRVVTCNGADVTSPYMKGAQEALKTARFFCCECAVLKERSPSCGFGKIYDGTFKHVQIDGNGVTADLLSRNGIKIYGESRISELLQ